MKYKLKKRYVESKAYPLPKELQIDGRKLSAQILGSQKAKDLNNFQTFVTVGDYYGLTKHKDSKETADSKNWFDMLGGEPGTLGRYNMSQIRNMNDGEMNGNFNLELPILPGALNFSETNGVKNTMKYKLKKTYKESLTTSDKENMIYASKKLPKGEDLKFAQAFTIASDVDRLLSDLPTSKSSWWRSQLGGKSDITRYKVGQLRRMNDGEDDGLLVKDLNSIPGFTGKIIPGALRGANQTDPIIPHIPPMYPHRLLRSENNMKYKLKRADRIYMEGYKAALRDMYEENTSLIFGDPSEVDGMNINPELVDPTASGVTMQDLLPKYTYTSKKHHYSKPHYTYPALKKSKK